MSAVHDQAAMLAALSKRITALERAASFRSPALPTVLPVPIAEGGTGENNAVDARDALGITSIVGDGVWREFAPQIDQGVTTDIAKSITYSKVTRRGPTVIWQFGLAMTAAGTAGSAITLTLPVAASSGLRIVGNGSIADVSVGAAGSYSGDWKLASTTRIGLIRDASNNFVGVTPSFALASTDELVGTITYEAAT